MLTAASRPARKIPLCVLLGSKILFINIVDKIDSARLVLNLLNFSAIKGKLEEIRQETTCFEEFRTESTRLLTRQLKDVKLPLQTQL